MSEHSPLSDPTLAEPVLAEHSLISSCAPSPELSAGLRRRVLADCQTHIIKTTRIRRIKWATATATFAAILLLCFQGNFNATQSFDGEAEPVTTTPAAQAPTTLDHQHKTTSPGQMAVDQAMPNSDSKRSQPIEHLIEELGRRSMSF